MWIVLWVTLCVCSRGVYGVPKRPNIVVIVADDLGWNDVGFHGMSQIPTPNIDALAYSGLILQNYYTTPICTPSRAALMTGKHPIHLGMQHTVLFALEPRGLPLEEKLLPQYLKELGYKTHLVGKWHLGFHKKEYTPMYRGFDTHMGTWTGRIDHFDHTAMENGTWGFDLRRGFSVAHDLFGKYITDIYTDEATQIIRKHDKSSPLFLMIGHTAMHSGNAVDPIRASYKLENNFSYIEHHQRRKFAAVLHKLDESVGKVVESLRSAKLLDQSIILFTTDNGGPANGFNDNYASNYPLRGQKNTLWEGGVRGAALLWSPHIEKRSRIATQRMHISDWLPTLYTAAGGNSSEFHSIDGVDLWPSLSKDLPSPRTTILHNIDDIWGSASLTVGQWKVHQGTNYKGTQDSWYGPAANSELYDVVKVGKSLAGLALDPYLPDANTMVEMRKQATINCSDSQIVPCFPLVSPCLFNIAEDPCEKNNLATVHPDILEDMLKTLRDFNKTAVPPSNVPLDQRGDPKYWGRVYVNFMDYNMPSPCPA